ncbi:helix-turn-helix transcriptional regulator [Yinghuangia seranimata]|uniref:helix-turn-helix transcriptional regulator n=1 Tax=Yinghuangia seranimata TaxID=408067 RepID=UPI00248C155C|nr:helix-turn-helix transcriptional regulator [Yinghuangia seranimata]MDI2125525.1 helix-turn-helix transcriptional regulator [Yinghuangia seranimata]
MATSKTRTERRAMERTAQEIRLRGLRNASTVADVVDGILAALPDAHPLEAHRWAQGWDRRELSIRIDMVYERAGLAPPGVADAEICRWEHGDRRPNDERIDVLCQIYGTRPDRLGFGHDYSGAVLGHLEQAGLIDLYPLTTSDSKADLVGRLSSAAQHINMFGLTRNYYAGEAMLPLFEHKAAKGVPVRLYIMDPHCDSRRDRYRLEPAEAAMEDPDRYTREILRPLAEAASASENFEIYLYNFPCSFAMEEVDDAIRVMLYGHGKRGTDGPILTFQAGTEFHRYFSDQLRWIERLAAADPIPEPWRSKGIAVWRYEG